MSDQERISVTKIQIKVVPGSSKDEVVGSYGEGLKIRVTAAPEKGKANAAVTRLLAEHFGVKPTHIRIAAGASSPRKVVEIESEDL